MRAPQRLAHRKYTPPRFTSHVETIPMQPAQKPHRSKQDYATPNNFIKAVMARLDIIEFAFDFAADADNTKGAGFWTEEQDALSMSVDDWVGVLRGGWGWLNPPFTKIGPWAKRCMETGRAGGNVAFLVPASVGSNWFRDYVDGQARVLLLNGRLAFMPDKPTWLYPKDCILALYGPHVEAAQLGYEVWTWRNADPKL